MLSIQAVHGHDNSTINIVVVVVIITITAVLIFTRQRISPTLYMPSIPYPAVHTLQGALQGSDVIAALSINTSPPQRTRPPRDVITGGFMSRSHRPRRLQPRARCERYMSECVDMCSIDVKTFLPLGHVRFLTFF